MDDGSSSSSSSMSISASNSTSSNPDSDTKIAKVTKSIISHCTTIFDFTDLTPNEKRRVLENVTNAFSLSTTTPSSSSSKTTVSAAATTASLTTSNILSNVSSKELEAVLAVASTHTNVVETGYSSASSSFLQQLNGISTTLNAKTIANNNNNNNNRRHRDDDNDDITTTSTATTNDATSSTSPSVSITESELASFKTPSANNDGANNNNKIKSNTVASTSTPSLTNPSPFKRAKIFSDGDDNSGEETSRSHKKSSSSNSSSSNSSDNISSNSNNSSNNNKGSLLSTLGPKTQRTSSTTTTTTAPDENNVNMASRTNNKLTVARFLIQNLRGGRGYATTDYYIDLIKEKHGLYDLVSTMYDILQKKDLSHDSIMSHLWSVEFAGIVYKNGWRHRNMDGTYDRSMVKYDIDEGEPRILSSLATPLEQGQKGMCSGESATFYILVQSTSLEKVNEDKICVKIATPFSWECKEDDKKASLPQYPKITSVELNISSSVEDDWISVAEKTKCINVQRSWNNYFRGENSWKRDERILNVFYPRKPQYPQWNNDEITIIALLLKSDAKFKKSWTNILQYTFVNRSESATSMKWYQLKGKESFKIEHTGRGLTNDARIRLVKRLAKKRMMGLLERGCPTKDPHPDEVVEAKLRKRGCINDDTSETEKRKLFEQYRHLYY